MYEEVFKALIDRICEYSEIQLKKCIEEKKLQAVIREEIIFFIKDTIVMPSVLLLLSRLKNVCAPDEEHISFSFIESIAD